MTICFIDICHETHKNMHTSLYVHMYVYLSHCSSVCTPTASIGYYDDINTNKPEIVTRTESTVYSEQLPND